MKKTFIILLALIIAFGGNMPMMVHGEAELNVDLENTILKVKDLLDISDSYDGFTHRLDSYNEQVHFYLNWSDSKEILPNINVSIDSTGFITSFNRYYQNMQQETDKTPKISRAEAEKKALEFIQIIAPEMLSNIKLRDVHRTENSWDNNYSIQFYRVENNIPYYDNNIDVYVNKVTGEINSYYANWDKKIVFPDPAKKISMEEGKLAFENKIGLHLIYKNSYRDSNYYLAYGLLNTNKAIDALTGEALDLYFYGRYGLEETKDMAVGSGGITPEERKEIDKLTGIKDIKEIEKIGREILENDDTYKLVEYNLYSSYNNPGEFQWRLSFNKTIEENKIIGNNITLDAKTGALLNFYRYNEYDPNAKATIDKEAALILAKDYIEKINKDKVGEIEYRENESADQLSYYFSFIRKRDGVYIENDGIYVAVDAVNKMITSYNLNWYKGEIPPIEGIIPIDKAYEILYKEIEYELRYMTLYNYNSETNRDNKEIKLVYSLNPEKPVLISPKTGELLDYSGNPYKENKIIEYTDIENSYAKDKIKTLSEYGIGFNSSEFKPRDLMKQKDFLYLLWKSQYNYRTETEDNLDIIYKDLSYLNIVKEGERDEERVITKEEGVKYLIRALKYEKLAQADIFKPLWKDEAEISKGMKGYLNIAYGLKIIQGDGVPGGNIGPKYELRRQDGANMIYNFMFMN